MTDFQGVIEALHHQGYAHADSIVNYGDFGDRGAMHDAFERGQQFDPAPGNRWRSHGIVSVDCRSLEIASLPPRPYMQSLEYNGDDGGQERVFAPIAETLLTGPTLTFVVQRNVRLASTLFDDIGAARQIIVGIHLVSYRPTGNASAFSSPLWLHRDDERLVSVTLFNVSENLGGGENILTPGGRAIDAIINMRRSMETLFLTHKGLHGVFPMYSKDGRPAYRNIIIATIK